MSIYGLIYGKLIEDASAIPGEAEVLFKSNTEFVVESLKKIDHPLIYKAKNGERVFEITLKEK